MTLKCFGILFILMQAAVRADEVSICQPGDTHRLPHPKHCHMYYDCGMKGKSAPWLEEKAVECSYPFLFNTATMTCDFFTNVVCGTRHEPINGCEYQMNQCNGPHCRPCYLDFPECKGQSTGPMAIQHKIESPFFAFCFLEHFIVELSCPKDERGRKMIFDSRLKSCVKAGRI